MKTALSVKVDKKVRDDARKVAKKLGIPLSMVVNQQLKQFALDRRIEFSEPLIPNTRTKKILDETMRDIREGNWDKFSPELKSVEEMDAYLDKLK